ncbi:MAG: hypothetical protein U0263_15350 [Polyangiaceae bacterium]
MTRDVLELGDIGLDEGAHVCIRHELAGLERGDELRVRGSSPTLRIDLGAFCRSEGHDLREDAGLFILRRGAAAGARDRNATRAGAADAERPDAVWERPPASFGLAPRGARVEAGSPELRFPLDEKSVVWADEAGRLYAQAAAQQWDPEHAIPWHERVELPAELEDAVVQIMTYLIENETAALIVPARFAAQVHPHFREVQQLLAIQAADEARHIEVFTRRALLWRTELALSTAGGQASLATLIEEPDFSLAALLLSVLGEGSFLSLLWFLHEHGPDPVTRAVARLAAQDEARHVAFGLAHLARHVELEPNLLTRMASAIERRHLALSTTAGLNAEVFDALVLVAARSYDPAAIRRGYGAVVALTVEMDKGRRSRLEKLGFDATQAEHLSSLHTRNFM